MFRRKKCEEAMICTSDGKWIFCSPDVCKYINELERKIRNCEYLNRKLNDEIRAIKPVVENKSLKPAVSNKCSLCEFAVRSSWNNEVLSCCKDAVCEDFKKREEKRRERNESADN